MMTIENWVNELKDQLRDFDGETFGSEVKMADITLGYIDKQGLIHYHKIEYRKKEFKKISMKDEDRKIF